MMTNNGFSYTSGNKQTYQPAHCQPKPMPSHPYQPPKPSTPPTSGYPVKHPPAPTPTPKPETPPTSGYPTTPSPTPEQCYLNLEGKGPAGFLGDAMTGAISNTGANDQWKNYVVGSLGEAPKSFAPTHSDLVQCDDGNTPLLEGGLAGDPQRYLVHPQSESVHFMPPAGTNLRVYQDEGLTIDNRYEDINEGDQTNNVAATQSMATIVDPANGEKHKIFLNNGQTTYIKPDGSTQVIPPNAKEPFIIGDPKDPLAKLEMKTDNPGNVPITLTHYERYSPETLKSLQDKGIDPSAAMKVRLENEIRWGNRLADGNGATERAAAGTTDPVEVNQYYDMHVVNKASEGLAIPKAKETPTTHPPKETPKAEGTPSTSGNSGTTTGKAESAASALSQNPMFRTLLSLIQKAGLEDDLQALEAKGDVTVFAPTQKAFESLPAGVADALMKPENMELLKRILLYHISEPGAKLPAKNGRPTLFDSFNSDDQNVYVRRGNRGNVVNGKQITNAGKAREAKNGSSVIPVDQILIPPGVDLSKL
jgi:uncharacterized surface protein with fasciclin (FAS1) repeats